MAVNRRRPNGYKGPTARALNQLEKDALAALKYAREIRRRGALGEDMSAELEQESIDGVFRAEATHRYAGKFEFCSQICRIIAIDDESALVREETLFAALDALGYKRREREEYRPPMERYEPKAETAARFISKHAGAPQIEVSDILRDPSAAKSAYRRASKRLHPDTGGDTRLMQRLTEAHQTLTAHLN